MGNSYIIKIDGQEFDADDAALAELSKRGVAYQDVTPKAAGGGMLETIGDTLRGAAHGASFGLSDMDVGAFGGKSIADLAGLAEYDDVQRRSPTASFVGDIGGSVLSPVSKIGAVAKGGAMLGKVAGGLGKYAGAALEQGVKGAAGGALRSYAEGGDPMSGGLAGGAAGAVLGGATPALAAGVSGALKQATPLVQKGADKVGKFLGQEADKARLDAYGIGNAERQALAQRFGVDELPSKVAAMIEDVFPVQGIMGKSAAERAAQLGVKNAAGKWERGELRQIGDELGQAYETAGVKEGLDKFVPGAWSNAGQNLASKAEQMPTATAGERSLRQALGKNAEEIGQEAAPGSFQDMVFRKADMLREAHGGPAGSVPDVASKEAAKMSGDELKRQIDGMLQYATDDTRNTITELRKKYGDRALLQEMLQKKGATEQGGSILPLMAATALGSATMGPWGAALALITGTRNQAIQNFSKSQGMDTLANIARKGETLAPSAPKLYESAADYVGDVAKRGADKVARSHLPLTWQFAEWMGDDAP